MVCPPDPGPFRGEGQQVTSDNPWIEYLPVFVSLRRFQLGVIHSGISEQLISSSNKDNINCNESSVSLDEVSSAV